MIESFTVSVLIRGLADDLARRRREAAASGAAPDNEARRVIANGQELARLLRREASPIAVDRLRDLKLAALLESKPRIEPTETTQNA